jgi:hypothetical protein
MALYPKHNERRLSLSEPGLLRSRFAFFRTAALFGLLLTSYHCFLTSLGRYTNKRDTHTISTLRLWITMTVGGLDLLFARRTVT